MRIALLGNRARQFESAISYLNHTALLPDHLSEVAYLEAEICILCGFYEIVPRDYLENTCHRGWYMFHESDLPEGAGHAPLQWTVINGNENICVSFLRVSAKKFDSGEIVAKAYHKIERWHTIQDLRRISIDIEVQILNRYLPQIVDGVVILHEQVGERSYWRRRTPADSELSLDLSIRDQWDLLRVCDPIDYPAYIWVDGKKFYVRIERD